MATLNCNAIQADSKTNHGNLIRYQRAVSQTRGDVRAKFFFYSVYAIGTKRATSTAQVARSSQASRDFD